MKTFISIAILGIFAVALNARADINQSESYDSFTIDTLDQKPFSVVLSTDATGCGVVGLSGEMLPTAVSVNSEGQVILMNYSLLSSYVACNPFVPAKKQTAKTDPLVIRPAKNVTQVKLIVPAGYKVQLAQ
jgi:hypothetical protein